MSTPSQISLGLKGDGWGWQQCVHLSLFLNLQPLFEIFLLIFCFQQAGHGVLNSLLVVALLTVVMEREKRFFFLPPNLGMFCHSTLILHLSLKKTKQTKNHCVTFIHVCVPLCVTTYLQVSQKRVSHSLELEMQAFGSSLADAGS